MSLSSTRRALHGVAELLLAGPQHRRSGTIRLRVVPGGFATVAEPDLRVEGTDLVTASGRFPLTGTCAAVAAAAGLDLGAPRGLYQDGSAVSAEEELDLDPFYTHDLHACFEVGDEALRALAEDVTPVLWPEHFDVAVTLEEVNFGVSGGDSFLDEPYAYVGPHSTRTGPFWNAPFGAARPIRDLSRGDGVSAVVEFFTRGRDLAAGQPDDEARA
jgi:hypothetical protein